MESESPEVQISDEITLLDSERQRCEIWTRVMGYHRPLSSFNKGKKSEHKERLHFQESRCAINCQ